MRHQTGTEWRTVNGNWRKRRARARAREREREGEGEGERERRNGFWTQWDIRAGATLFIGRWW